MKKTLVGLALLAAILLAGFWFCSDVDLHDVKLRLDMLMSWHDRAPVTSLLAFFSVYILVTALSLPIALPMTLAAGALFGFVTGALVVSFATSIGATLAFLGARYFFRDTIRQRFSARLGDLDRGMERDGAFYLFTLRLIPIFPFFLVNLAMGLTSIRVSRYYWVSQIGMLPATLVYVNAGTQLARIDSLHGLMSPMLIGSFVLIGLFPWIARFLVNAWRRRKVYRAFERPTTFDRNLVVIGAGAAGLVSTYIATAVRAKVTLVEEGAMGGDCLNYGCVPSKALIRSARLCHEMRHGERYGVSSVEPAFSFPAVMARINGIIATIAPNDSVERYEAMGAEVLKGRARIIDPFTVEITLADGGIRRLTTRSIILATGAAPVMPDLPGIQDVAPLTSDTLWARLSSLEALPQRIVVLGGGPIGCELSQAFRRLGAEVTQVERGERLMAREDLEVSQHVLKTLASEGVSVLCETKAVRFGRDADGKFAMVEHAGHQRRLDFDMLIVAVGRAPRLSGFGLEELGVRSERTIDANEYLETLYPNIFAAGDVAGPYQFTHVASHQAWHATVNALFGLFRKFPVDYRIIPMATFTDPEVARVGLTEQEAREKGIAVEVVRYEISDLDRAIADGEAAGFVKVLTPPGSDRILGVSIVGHHAAEIIAEFVLAMKQGIGLNKILGTIHIYPTMAEANKYVAGAWRKAHVSPLALRVLERFHRWRRGGSAATEKEREA